MAMTYVRKFLAFLYDFLVGDSWELFVGPIAALIVAWALLQVGVSAGVVGIALFVIVTAVGALNVVIALRQSA
jgi:hypothetical protein